MPQLSERLGERTNVELHFGDDLRLDLRSFFFFNDTATTEIHTLSLHDALPISRQRAVEVDPGPAGPHASALYASACARSEEHTSELQSRGHLVCRLLLEKK